MTVAIPGTVLFAIGGVFALLALASAVVFSLTRRQPERDHRELARRVKSWWVMVGVFAVAMVLSPVVTLVFFGVISFLALKEYLSLIPTRRADRRVLFWAYLAVPVQYYWVGIAWYGMFIIFVPVYMFLLLPARMVVAGETRGFLKAVGTLHWGLMTTVYSIGHAAYLLVLPAAGNPVGGGAGLLFFLIFLTEFNDVAQYVWGRLLGRHKVVPSVSPKKTWQGLAGGVLTTILVAWLIAPYLTPFDGWQRLAAGALIGLAGFFGDITISAVKRDLEIKDSGAVIPGHGGVLDRLDSLTFTAPLFFHFTYYFHY